jgi:methionyl-tRNA formyltransferase
MSRDSTYIYATGDLLEKRNTYTYTGYHGDELFADWRQSRALVLAQLSEPMEMPLPSNARSLALILEGSVFCTAEMLESLMRSLSEGEITGVVTDSLARLVTRFEVSKRVHSQYLPIWRAVPAADYHDLLLYLRYAEVMELSYSRIGKVVYLNVLLKVLDTLSATSSRLPSSQSGRLASLLTREQVHINKLLSAA